MPSSLLILALLTLSLTACARAEESASPMRDALALASPSPWPAMPMPCAMLSPYISVRSERDESIMASCCAILQRQSARFGALTAPIPGPCSLPVDDPLPSPEASAAKSDPLLPECAPCQTDADCKQGTCWGEPKMCTDFSWKSLKNCFKQECTKCKMDEQCSTRRCWLGRCSYKTNLGQARCFPVHVLDLITGR